MISQLSRALNKATTVWQITVDGYLSGSHLFHSYLFINYSISCTMLLYLCTVIKIEVIIRVIKIVTQPEKIFVLIAVTVYQMDTVRNSEETSLVTEGSFHMT